MRTRSPTLAMQYVQAVLEARFNVGAPILNDPALLQNFVHVDLGRRDGEVFAVILLDRSESLDQNRDSPFRG